MEQLPADILRQIPRNRREWILLSLTSVKIAEILGEPTIQSEYIVKTATGIIDYKLFISNIPLNVCIYVTKNATMQFQIAPGCVRNLYDYILGIFIYKSHLFHLHNANKFLVTPTDTVFYIYNKPIIMTTRHAKMVVDSIKNELPHIPIRLT